MVQLTKDNVGNFYDGLKVDCPECHRSQFLLEIIENRTKDCACGTTLGPLELQYEP